MTYANNKKLNPQQLWTGQNKEKREREREKSEKAKSLKDQSKKKPQTKENSQMKHSWSCKWTVCRTERKN